MGALGRPLNFTVRSPAVTTVPRLVEDSVYFIFSYMDEDMRFPDLSSWVFLGIGVLPEAGPDAYVFQSVESFCSEGKWTTLSQQTREGLGPEALLACSTAELDLFVDIAQLQAELAEYAARVSGKPGS
jgi:hypothetical protein